MSAPEPRPGSLGVLAGTVMLVGAVLGPGVLTLPALAADAAGASSLLAWVLLLCASVPVATTFAALGGALPDRGGVAHFATLAFGPRRAAPVGWWFLAAVPTGVVAASLMGGHYVAAALGLAPERAFWIGTAILGASFSVNALGLRATGRTQVITAGVLVALLVPMIAVSLGRMRPEAFSPFAPGGWTGVGTAASLLFFAFAGWEAATHLSADLRDPRRTLRRSTLLALGVIILLYSGLALVAVGVLGDAAGDTPVPLLVLMRGAFGPVGTAFTAVAALLLTSGAINVYLASGARLGAALGTSGMLPRVLVGRTTPGREPRRSLAFLAGCCTIVAIPVAADAVTVDWLVRGTSALLISVSLAGTAAAVWLLRDGPRRVAGVASVLLGILLLASGPFLLLPAGVGAVALGVGSRRPRAAGPPPSAVDGRARNVDLHRVRGCR
ncbi:amino acid permease [Nocardioides sp. QY071]|uniref:APC family permease n=1 Tax=Nocardioides sp. QY071 TaxID=3044187 RepID=UPI00249BCA16|nr:amino acid permease [Nocardioides sp. QY071]WGY00481.1 amino acid permease [Nocardioides sp. QY071]